MVREILTALALVLVLEGIMPFLSPAGLKRAMVQLLSLDDRALRGLGLASMLAGVVLLYVVRHA